MAGRFGVLRHIGLPGTPIHSDNGLERFLTAAVIVAVAAAVTLSAVQAPSALAQVRHAAARTAAASYRVRAVEHIVRMGGLRSQPWTTVSGEFDPAQGVGQQTGNLGAQIRYTGGYIYVFVTGSLRAGARAQGTPIPAWATWERLPIRLQPGVRAGVVWPADAEDQDHLRDFGLQVSVRPPPASVTFIPPAG